MLKLYRVQISTLQGKRWISKRTISAKVAKAITESSRVCVLQVVEA